MASFTATTAGKAMTTSLNVSVEYKWNQRITSLLMTYTNKLMLNTVLKSFSSLVVSECGAGLEITVESVDVWSMCLPGFVKLANGFCGIAFPHETNFNFTIIGTSKENANFDKCSANITNSFNALKTHVSFNNASMNVIFNPKKMGSKFAIDISIKLQYGELSTSINSAVHSVMVMKNTVVLNTMFKQACSPFSLEVGSYKVASFCNSSMKVAPNPATQLCTVKEMDTSEWPTTHLYVTLFMTLVKNTDLRSLNAKCKAPINGLMKLADTAVAMLPDTTAHATLYNFTSVTKTTVSIKARLTLKYKKASPQIAATIKSMMKFDAQFIAMLNPLLKKASCDDLQYKNYSSSLSCMAPLILDQSKTLCIKGKPSVNPNVYTAMHFKLTFSSANAAILQKCVQPLKKISAYLATKDFREKEKLKVTVTTEYSVKEPLVVRAVLNFAYASEDTAAVRQHLQGVSSSATLQSLIVPQMNKNLSADGCTVSVKSLEYLRSSSSCYQSDSIGVCLQAQGREYSTHYCSVVVS